MFSICFGCGLFAGRLILIRSTLDGGVTGLLNIPTADMQVDGTFMVGANYLPEQMLPDFWDYNSGNYFLNVTFLPCLEIGYRCTLMKLKTGKWNQGPFGVAQDTSVERGTILAVGGRGE